MGRKKKRNKHVITSQETEEKEKLEILISSGELEVEVKDLRVKMPKALYQKMMSYTLATEEEISGLGMCKWTDDEILVYELFLLKQTNSSASTELDDEEVSKLINTLVRDNRNTAELRFWWHRKAA